MKKQLTHIKYGMMPIKARIVLLQKTLIDHGYSKVSVNGINDRSTKRALVDFQNRNNITPNGIVNEETFKLLKMDEEIINK